MHITEAAQQHFRALLKQEETQEALKQEEKPNLQLRIYVANPGTPYAEIGLTFCPEKEAEETDIIFPYDNFKLYMEAGSLASLQDAHIDFKFKEDSIEGQLSIKAPNLRGQAPAAESPLEKRLQYVLDAEINPMLAGHGGRVKLVEILQESIAMLQFGGGCHGCGMANVTLKQGIEKTLKERFPEIIEVRDITDHASGENPYYIKERETDDTKEN